MARPVRSRGLPAPMASHSRAGRVPGRSGRASASHTSFQRAVRGEKRLGVRFIVVHGQRSATRRRPLEPSSSAAPAPCQWPRKIPPRGDHPRGFAPGAGVPAPPGPGTCATACSRARSSTRAGRLDQRRPLPGAVLAPSPWPRVTPRQPSPLAGPTAVMVYRLRTRVTRTLSGACAMIGALRLEVTARTRPCR